MRALGRNRQRHSAQTRRLHDIKDGHFSTSLCCQRIPQLHRCQGVDTEIRHGLVREHFSLWNHKDIHDLSGDLARDRGSSLLERGGA